MSASSNRAASASREPRRHSIAAKIVFLVFLCTFTTALVLSGIAIQSQHRELREEVEVGVGSALERSRGALDHWLREGATGLEMLAADRRQRERFAAAAARPTQKRRNRVVTTLAAFAEDSVHFDAVALLSPKGEWLVHSEGFVPASGARLAARPDADRASQLSLALEEGVAALSVSPVERGNPDAGFLAARYDPSFLAQLLDQQRHDVEAGLALTDGDGRVLARLDGPEGSLAHPETSAARLHGEPPGVLREYASPDGVHTLGARLPIDSSSEAPEHGWQLVAELPYAVAFQPLTALLTRIFLVDLGLSLAFITAAYRVSTRMLRPIEDLAEAARVASSGNLGQAISDPRTHDEIGRLTRAFNDMMGKLHESQSDLREANRQLMGRNDDLQRANEVLSQLSITDGLTKLHNHRYFQECLTREIKRQSRTAKPLSMLLVDLDDFKALNDSLGHASGDELLVRVASILDATVRESDLLARYGGEEFVVLAIDTDLEGAIALAEKIRMNVEQAPHIVNESLRPVRITVSVGVAQYAGNRRQFFESADRALYRAKDQGKNCVVSSSEDGASE